MEDIALPEIKIEAYGTVTPPPTREATVMTKYRVEQDGQTIWSGEGDGLKAIPEEYRGRPSDTPEGQPHAPARFLYASDGDEEVLIGVQLSLAESQEMGEQVAREAFEAAVKAEAAKNQET